MAGNYAELWAAQEQIKPNQKWVNKKHGTTYEVMGVGRRSEPTAQGELLVEVVYMNENFDIWIRPWKLFLEKFTRLENGQ